MWSGDLFQCLSRSPMTPSWQALLISHKHFWIWHLWGKNPIESPFFFLTLAITCWARRYGWLECAAWTKMVRPSKPCSLASKIQAQNFTREETKSCEKLILLMLIHEFLLIYRISYTFLQTHLNTFSQSHQANPPGGEPQDLNPPNPPKTWLWQGSSKICPKIDGPNVLRSQKAVKCQIVACSQLWPNPGEIVLCQKLHAKRSTFERWLATWSDINDINSKILHLQISLRLLRNRCSGRQATQWSKGQKCRLHGFQRYFGCGNHRGLFIFDTCTRSMNINGYQWIKLNQQTQKVCSFGVSDS